MGSFLLNRLSQSLILLALVSVIGFAVLYLAPGDPLSQFAFVPGMTQEQLACISHEMGLDRPLPLQYWEWVSRFAAATGATPAATTSPCSSSSRAGCPRRSS